MYTLVTFTAPFCTGTVDTHFVTRRVSSVSFDTVCWSHLSLRLSLLPCLSRFPPFLNVFVTPLPRLPRFSHTFSLSLRCARILCLCAHIRKLTFLPGLCGAHTLNRTHRCQHVTGKKGKSRFAATRGKGCCNRPFHVGCAVYIGIS